MPFNFHTMSKVSAPMKEKVKKHMSAEEEGPEDSPVERAEHNLAKIALKRRKPMKGFGTSSLAKIS